MERKSNPALDADPAAPFFPGRDHLADAWREEAQRHGVLASSEPRCPNGHADPIYISDAAAECAVCGVCYAV